MFSKNNGYTDLIKTSAQLNFNFSGTALVEEGPKLTYLLQGAQNKIMNFKVCVTYDQDCHYVYAIIGYNSAWS